MKERVKFVLEWEKRWNEGEGLLNFSELCREFGVSRQVGYDWIKRYRDASYDVQAVKERSRRPRSSPTKASDDVEAFLVANATWCVDFKGHFRTQDGRVCYPLTIIDAYSRFLIRCEGVEDPNGREAQRIFDSAFKEFGLPATIRSDNGPPFASVGAGGLTTLSVWWLRLGIRVERIEPGKAATERPARALSSHAQSRNDRAGTRRHARAATCVRFISSLLQRRATSRSAWTETSVDLLRTFRSPLSMSARAHHFGCAVGPRDARRQRWLHSMAQTSTLHQSCART
jgi:hypothetical protein